MPDKVNILDAESLDVLEAFELTEEERREFDYLDWQALEDGRDSASFVRYRGETYDLGEFMAVDASRASSHSPFIDWHGVQSDTFFSGVLVRYITEDENGTYDYGERVTMARYYA
jgi:hypothetical protein